MDFKKMIRVVEDFPIEGISYKDITTLIKDKEAFRAVTDTLAGFIEDDIDFVAGPEARGFIFGTALAYKIGAGFVPVRKPGKLPAETLQYEYELEYGTDFLEIHKDAVFEGANVLLVDDLIATGGTLEASAKLIELAGGKVCGILALIELTDLGGREKLKDYKVSSIVTYPS